MDNLIRDLLERVPRATTPPPKPSALETFDVLSRVGAASGVYLEDAVRSLLGGKVAAKGQATAPTKEAREEGARLAELSSIKPLPVLIVATEFQNRMRISGKRYDPASGFEQSTVELAGGSAAGKVTLLGLTKDDLFKQSSEVIVVDKPESRLNIEAQAPWAELLFLLAIDVVRHAVVSGKHAKYAWACLVTDVVVEVTSMPIHRLKHLLQVPRPLELVSSTQQTVIPTPAYKSFPGGHAALCGAMAVVTARMLRDDSLALPSAALGKLAESIAQHRVDAGLHTKHDTVEGLKLGRAIGSWMVGAAGNAEFPSWSALFSLAGEQF